VGICSILRYHSDGALVPRRLPAGSLLDKLTRSSWLLTSSTPYAALRSITGCLSAQEAVRSTSVPR
jgi:hypothetical protein